MKFFSLCLLVINTRHCIVRTTNERLRRQGCKAVRQTTRQLHHIHKPTTTQLQQTLASHYIVPLQYFNRFIQHLRSSTALSNSAYLSISNVFVGLPCSTHHVAPLNHQPRTPRRTRPRYSRLNGSQRGFTWALSHRKILVQPPPFTIRFLIIPRLLFVPSPHERRMSHDSKDSKLLVIP